MRGEERRGEERRGEERRGEERRGEIASMRIRNKIATEGNTSECTSHGNRSQSALVHCLIIAFSPEEEIRGEE